ncbi:unnamed protein product [Fraxinus pennsylvanica]|uniref:Uncharacterized protein n=1 Tax=Fraxinus pennsylvanica TaxID=56036 RepID=A0AAD2DR61_9LAMI|nr:unnamed protein product [Fraxinus pennsylvanica]
MYCEYLFIFMEVGKRKTFTKVDKRQAKKWKADKEVPNKLRRPLVFLYLIPFPLVLLARDREVASRLDAKCDKLADAVIDDTDSSTGHQSLAFRLPERVKLIIEEIEKETEWREDLYSSDKICRVL